MERLFNSVIAYGQHVRKHGRDGLKYWNDIKPMFQSNSTVLPLRNTYRRSYRLVNLTATSDDDVAIEISGYTFKNLKSNGEIDERNHYLVQLFRIPHLACHVGEANEEPITILKLMQIAYNIGQLQAVRDQYPTQVVDWLEEHNLLSISGYVRV